jgi:signal transduction histidine kinase
MSQLDEEGISPTKRAKSFSGFYSTSPNEDFVDLCRAQILNLSKSVLIDWVGVYLVQKEVAEHTHLMPLVVYPEACHPEFLIENLSPSLMVPRKFIGTAQISPLAKPTQQIILPLLNQAELMGLLVVVRSQENWLEKELLQIENTAKVIAIAKKMELDYELAQKEIIQLKKEQELQRDYLDDLIHQLRNPVTALRTFAKLLMKKFAIQFNEDPAIKGILRESERIVDLLQNSEGVVANLSITNNSSPILNLLQEAKKLPLEKLELKEILEPLLNSFLVIAHEKGLDFRIEIPENIPIIEGNKQGLIEVISNLVDNAIKYTPSPGIILVKVECENQWIKLSINDNGYGIVPEEQEHIFERHFRGKSTKDTIAGSGLGLDIVKDLLDQMEAKIEVISPSQILQGDHGGGSTFIVWIFSSTGN